MIPPWMKTNMPQRVALEGDDDDDEEGAKWEIGDTPGTAGLSVCLSLLFYSQCSPY